jgi:hypothetical protein
VSRPHSFLFEFKRTVDYILTQVEGVSRRDFVRLYDYDDFLDGDASQCQTARELAIAFASRFLGSVNPAYFRALSFSLVRFLARQSGHDVGDNDKEALKSLAQIDAADMRQLLQWLDAYFPGVL